MHPGSQRLPFDPAGPFMARRTVRLNGTLFAGGDELPPNIADDRKLRQLFDLRKIDVKTKQDEIKQIEQRLFPEDWRTLTNRVLFPLVQEAYGIKPKNRVHAFSLVNEHGAA